MKVEQLFGASIKYMPGLSNAVNSIYAVSSTANHFLFDVMVNNLTGEMKVLFADTTEVEIDAQAKLKADMSDEGVTSRPSSDSVKRIIYPRIITLISNHYMS